MVERYSSETRLNQAGNLIADATGTHASHPVYTTFLDNALRRINLSQPGTAIRQQVEGIINLTRQQINDNPGVNSELLTRALCISFRSISFVN